MREGVKAKIVWPKIVLERVPAQIDKQLVAKPEESPVLQAVHEIPTKPSRSLTATASPRPHSEAITSAIIPSFQKLKIFFVDEYLPAAPEWWASGRCRKARSSMPI